MTGKCFEVCRRMAPDLLNKMCCIKCWACLKGIDEKGLIIEPFEVCVKVFTQISVGSGSDNQCGGRGGRENLMQGHHLLVFKQGSKLVNLRLIALYTGPQKKGR